MAKSLKDRICEGLEDRQGLIMPVIRHLMAEAWAEGWSDAAGWPQKDINPYLSDEKEQRDGGSEAVRPR